MSKGDNTLSSNNLDHSFSKNTLSENSAKKNNLVDQRLSAYEQPLMKKVRRSKPDPIMDPMNQRLTIKLSQDDIIQIKVRKSQKYYLFKLQYVNSPIRMQKAQQNLN